MLKIIGAAAVLAAVRAGVPFHHLAKIHEPGLEIFARRDVAQVIVVFIRAGDHVFSALQSGVGQDRHVLDSDRSERPCGRAREPSHGEPFLERARSAVRGRPGTRPRGLRLPGARRRGGIQARARRCEDRLRRAGRETRRAEEHPWRCCAGVRGPSRSSGAHRADPTPSTPTGRPVPDSLWMLFSGLIF